LKRLALLLVALAILAGVLSVYWVGGRLAAPAPREIGALPADLPGRALKVISPAAGVLKGWLLPGRRDGGAVLLLHGVRASRLDMLGRARFLHAQGYTVMLFDSRAHGESGGQRITFGYLESLGPRRPRRCGRCRAPATWTITVPRRRPTRRGWAASWRVTSATGPAEPPPGRAITRPPGTV
jgi:pimeloyl-ACP methyl ester carboxylesterase